MIFSSWVIIMQLDKIGKFIAQLRKEKRLTQKELGEIINIDKITITTNNNIINIKYLSIFLFFFFLFFLSIIIT